MSDCSVNAFPSKEQIDKFLESEAERSRQVYIQCEEEGIDDIKEINKRLVRAGCRPTAW